MSVVRKSHPSRRPLREMPLPEFPDGSEQPTAAAYRLTPDQIDTTVCVGRTVWDADKRWKPQIHRERQCGGAVVEGSDLCAACIHYCEEHSVKDTPSKHSRWNGRVTEEPPSWCPMLGTERSAKCKWNPLQTIPVPELVEEDIESTVDPRDVRIAELEAALATATAKIVELETHSRIAALEARLTAVMRAAAGL